MLEISIRRNCRLKKQNTRNKETKPEQNKFKRINEN